MTVLEKQPSPELLSLMKAAASSIIGFGELWDSIKKKGKDEGFQENELEKMFAPMVKDRLTENQMRYLFNKEAEVKRSQENRQKQKEELKTLRTYTVNYPKNVLDQTPIPEELPPNAPTKTAEQFYKEQDDLKEKGVFSPEDTEEEPTPLELAEIKIKHLEEALKKTEQFNPATVLQSQDAKVNLTDPKGLIEKAILTEENVFDWLNKRDDKITCFYFGSCGTGFIKSNILKNLENSGIKTFKRLYFEV